MKILFKLFSLLTILTLLLPGFAFGGVQHASAEGNPQLSIHINENAVFGFGWPQPGVDVTVTVDDPRTSDLPDYKASPINWDPVGYYYYLQLGNSFQLQPGQLVTMTDGSTTKSITIIPFAVTNVDSTADTVSGQTAPGMVAFVDIFAEMVIRRQIYADQDGNWKVDFSVPGIETFEQQTYDIIPGSTGQAYTVDSDGDTVQVNWNVPAPIVGVNPVWNTASAIGMPLGTELTLTIVEAGEIVFTSQPATVAQNPDNLGDIRADFDLQGFDIKVGQVLTVSGGGVSTTYTVTDFAITNIDPLADTISGVATPGSQMQICANLPGRCAFRYPVADGIGNWEAVFHTPGSRPDEQDTVDIQAGSNGWGNEKDWWGNQTWSAWNLPPPPHIEAFAWFDRYSLMDWPASQTVHVTIDDPATEGLDYWTDFTPDASNSWYDLYPGIDLQPGMVITAANGDTSKTLEISTLSATAVDPINETVQGVATPNTQFHMSTGGDNFINRVENDPVTSEFGEWSIDFAGVADLGYWTIAQMWETDSDGDVTFAYWHVHQEAIEIWPAQEEIRAFDWPLETELTFTVYDPESETTQVFYAPTEPVNWMDGTQAVVNFSGASILKPGVEVTVTGSDATKSVVMQDLKITSIDPFNDIVYGYAPPNAALDIISWKDDPYQRFLVAGEDGAWMVDYRIPGVKGNTVDLTPGDTVRIAMREADIDATVWESTVRLPTIVASPSEHWVHGLDWQLGVELTLTIGGNTAKSTTVVASWDPNTVDAYFDLTGQVDLAPGDVVTVTDDHVTKELTIKYLEVTGVDLNQNVITGKGVYGDNITVVSEGRPADYASVTPDENGNWSATLTNGAEIFQLSPGDNGYAAIGDEDGDWMRSYWRVHYPWMVINFAVGSQFIEGFDWPANSDISLTIYSDKDRTETLVGPITQTADGSGSLIFTTEGFNVLPGMLLEMTNGSVTKEHVVLPITVSEASAETDYYAGYTTANSPIGICIWDGSGCVNTTSDDTGYWRADFTSAGIDIQPGVGANVDQNDEDGDRTSLGYIIPNPRFDVRANTDQVEGYEWLLGETLTLAVNGQAIQEATVGEASWDPNTTYVSFNLSGVYDIQPGQTVSLSNGPITKETVVSTLEFTEINVDNDTVSGIAPAYSTINLWACIQDGCYNRYVTADGDGSWSADFANPGIEPDEQNSVDIIGGTWIDSRQWDDNSDSTMYGRNAPWLIAFPENEAVEGWEWPDGASMHLAIDDPDTEASPDFEDDGVAAVTTWGDTRTYIRFDFAGEYDLKVNNIVTLTDGVTTRMHTVRNLDVTATDAAEDIVDGAADVGAEVQVWPHETGQTLITTADVTGKWQVDFTGTFDLVAATGGRSQTLDAIGNATAVDWNVPNPRFEVRANVDQVEAWEWTKGETLYLSVNGQEIQEATVGEASWDPNTTYVSFNLSGSVDIQMGDFVSLTNRDITKTTEVTILEITGIDVDQDLVFGKAEPDSKVDLWACPPSDNCYNRHVTADEAGDWVANFHIEGEQDDEKNVVNIGGGTWVDSRQWDDDSDATMYGRFAPWLIAFPEWDYIEGFEWIVNTSVHLAIDDPNTVEFPDKELDKNAEPKPWDPGNPIGWVIFDDLEGYDLKVGDVVVLTAGYMRTSHTVLNLAVTTLDPDADIIAGTADPGAVVQLWPHGFDQIATLQATADQDGNWVADFSGLYDLAEGESGRLQTLDAIGNATAMDWGIPVLDWLQANIDGFGNPASNGVTALESFNGQLYAGASNWNQGAQVWRLDGNGDWQPVSEPGFGNDVVSPAIIDLADFRGKLYAGVGWGDSAPGQVWRSSDGMTWQPVTLDGFGEPTNNAITNFVVFKGKLYAGVSNSEESAQIWRSNTGNDGSWVEVAPDGPGIPGNVTGFVIYKNVLYTAIEPPTEGGPVQVWRSSDGSAWSTVVADGFGDADNISTGGFAEFLGYLYLGTRNETTGAQLWRTKNGIQWELAVGDGFGDAANIKIESLLVYDELLYAVAYNDQQGLQVWRTADGKSWEHILADGFMDSGNYSTLWNNATIEFAGEYLVGTWNNNTGGELWVYTQVPVPPDEESWHAAYTYDLPARFWDVGSHTYHFDFEWSFPEPGTFSGQGGDFSVATSAPLYNGHVLLRGPAEIANVGLPDAPVCEGVPAINPAEPTRFHVGWVNDNPMNFMQALAHFGSLTARANWDGGMSIDLIQHEINPSIGFDWSAYTCTYTMR